MTERRTLYPEIEPYQTGMLDVGDGHYALLGAVRHAGGQAGRLPPWRARARGSAPTTAASSTRRNMTSCCSTSAARANRRRTPTSRPTPPGIWSRISSGCATCAASRNGWCSAEAGARRSALPMPRPIPSESPNWCCAASSCSGRANSTGSIAMARRKLYPEGWDDFLAPVPQEERGDLISAYRRLLTGDDQRRAAPRRQGVEQMGRADRHPAARSRRCWPSSPRTSTPSPSRGSRTITCCTRAGWRKASCCEGAEKLRGIPGVIVQGRHDCCTPPRAAWELKRAWPEVELKSSPTAATSTTSRESSTA